MVFTLNLSFPCPETLEINRETTQKPNLPNPTHKKKRSYPETSLPLGNASNLELQQTKKYQKHSILSSYWILAIVVYPPRYPNIPPQGLTLWLPFFMESKNRKFIGRAEPPFEKAMNANFNVCLTIKHF